MSEKQFVLYEHKGNYYILQNPRLHLDFIEMLGDALTDEEIVDKLNEQQTTIERLQKKLSECQGHKLELTPIPISRPITLKEAEDSIRITKYEELFDDEPFIFNKNCAKPYEIRSVSPNGVIRIGSKNHKVKWRMKDVREINNELPPREEFNREEYNKLRNKYHTKNWCGDNVLGRIIYNIYNGTFGDYL